MNKQDKIFEVQNLTAKIKNAKAIAFTDFGKLTVAQINQLREKVKEAGGELQVVKNNLVYRALRDNNYKVDKSKFDGQNLAVFANTDEVGPLKALVTLGKTFSALPLKIGFMNGQIFTPEELSRFAALPSKIQLQAKLVGMLASPTVRLVRSLNWNLQKLVLVLEAVKSKKQ